MKIQIDDLGTLSWNEQNAALIAKARAGGVKVLLSIGGGSASEDKVMRSRYFKLLRDTHRTGFVAKLADYVAQHNFDGLDVDLEGPAINRDYSAFIADLATALKPNGKLLTAALSQGYGGKAVADSVFAHFDFINLMAYDATGPWEPKAPGQHSSLTVAQSTIDYWLKRGLPASKAVLGVPFYGWGFGAAFRQEEYSYASILAKYRGAQNVDQIGKTIYYNGVPTLQAKARLVREANLGGMMIWSLNSDSHGPHSLLNALHVALTSPATRR